MPSPGIAPKFGERSPTVAVSSVTSIAPLSVSLIQPSWSRHTLWKQLLHKAWCFE